MHIDLNTLKPGHVYGLFTQLLIPRPIAWVLSDNGNGEYNLAPFSYFTGISSKPPLLMISIGKKNDGSNKDTLTNIESRDNFVVHIPSTNHQNDVTTSADPLPAGESEVIKQGLELDNMTDFSLPRLKNCQIAFACSKHQIIRLEGVDQSMVIGRVKSVYIADDVVTIMDNKRMNVSALAIDPLCRLGSSEYGSLGKVIPG
ncbi:MAG: flavin reductase family protein [Magnetococcales bacterium]|nr:flavin reductase family protein [Magnetococcales bacterium]